jgi:DUF1365 family protein
MQINSVNNQSPSFGRVNLSNGASSILSKCVKDSPFEARRLQKAIEFARNNDKVNVHFYVNDDNKTLFACFENVRNKNIIKKSTENFFTRLIEGPVDFVQGMVLKAEQLAKSISL